VKKYDEKMDLFFLFEKNKNELLDNWRGIVWENALTG